MRHCRSAVRHRAAIWRARRALPSDRAAARYRAAATAAAAATVAASSLCATVRAIRVAADGWRRVAVSGGGEALYVRRSQSAVCVRSVNMLSMLDVLANDNNMRTSGDNNVRDCFYRRYGDGCRAFWHGFFYFSYSARAHVRRLLRPRDSSAVTE